jgi:hypothetical protein
MDFDAGPSEALVHNARGTPHPPTKHESRRTDISPGILGERSVRESHAGQHRRETPKGGSLELVWRVEALPNTHENFTCGAPFVDHSNSRGSLFYRELRTDDGIEDS